MTPTTSCRCASAARSGFVQSVRPMSIVTRSEIMHKRLGIEDSDLEIADAISRFAQSELLPRAAQVDREELSTTRYVAQLAELGVMGRNLPERWGGVEASPVALVLSLVE